MGLLQIKNFFSKENEKGGGSQKDFDKRMEGQSDYLHMSGSGSI